MAKDYSEIKLFLLRAFLSARGLWRKLWLKKGKKYFGGRNNRQGVYLGNNVFYETFEISGLGYLYYDSRKIKYKNWELGKWEWK